MIGLLAGASAFLFTRPAAAADRTGHIPNIELTTQDGKRIHFYDDLVKGKIVAIELMYTTCQYSCPLETARMAQVQKILGSRVGNDIFFYSITIDPEHDTPAVLKAYMEKFHVGPGWTFLTGKKGDIDFLSKSLGIYSDPSVNADGHIPHMLIGNEATGQWLRNSAVDNPSFQARMIGEFLDSFQHSQLTSATSEAQAQIKFDQGQYQFGRMCAACHTIGHGDKIGPDLLGITNVRDRKWLLRMIQTPDKLLAEKDPIAQALFEKYKQVPMPNVYTNDADANAILNFLEAQTASHEKSASAADTGASKPADRATAPAPPDR
jgi:protein SCO1/2